MIVFRKAAILIVGGFSASAAAGPIEDTRAATASAENALATIDGRPCPVFGDRTYIAGAANAADLSNAAEREITFSRNTIGTLSRLAGDPQVSQRSRLPLVTLGSWTAAASLANWALLTIGAQALADPIVLPGQPHPAEVSRRAEGLLSEFSRDPALHPDVRSFLSRLRSALGKCAAAARSATVVANEAAIRTAIHDARTSADLERVESMYWLRQSSGAGAAPIIATWQDRLSAIEAREANARAASAREASAREASASGRASSRPAPALADAPTKAQLAAARRFLTAASRQNEAAALAELSADVELRTPQGSYSGKADVAAAVRQQAAQGRSGGLGAPVISGEDVVAPGVVSGFNVLTYFEFNSSNKINRMTIRLN